MRVLSELIPFSGMLLAQLALLVPAVLIHHLRPLRAATVSNYQL